MKASQAGSVSPYAGRILDHFATIYNFEGYIRAKYDGLLPDNFPTKKSFREINERINYHFLRSDSASVKSLHLEKARMIRTVRAFQKEFIFQQ